MTQLKITVLEEDIGLSDTWEETCEESELQKHMDRCHGCGGEFKYELDVPQRNQYDDTYFKTFTVSVI